MTRALLIADAHLADLATLLAVLPLSTMAGEYGVGAGLVYPLAGLAGVIALKVAGIGLLVALAGESRLRLSLAVLAGLAGAAVNSVAYVVLRGG